MPDEMQTGADETPNRRCADGITLPTRTVEQFRNFLRESYVDRPSRKLRRMLLVLERACGPADPAVAADDPLND